MNVPGTDWDPTRHYQNVDVAEKYDRQRFSSVSGAVFNALERRCVIKAFSALPPNSLILDAPCSAGRLSEMILEHGHRVVGMDVSPQMLDLAKQKLARFGARFQTRIGDVRELVYQDKEFDAALCAHVLMHFPLEEQVVFLRGVAKAAGGKVAFNQSLNTPYYRFRRKIERLLGNQDPVDFPITPQEANELILQAGLTKKKMLRVFPLISEAVFFICR